MVATVLWVAAFLILLFCLARYLEYKSLYFPIKEIITTPDCFDMPFEKVLFIARDGVKISAWWMQGRGNKVLLFFHGNGGNRSHRIEKCRQFIEMGLSVLIIDYRGYGDSEGKASEKGLCDDAEASYRYLIEDKGVTSSDIFIYGESLGGAVAIHLASVAIVGGLIVEDSFTSIRQMARYLYPLVPGCLVRNQYASIHKIGKITCPKLLFHSVDDEIIPFEMGRALYNKMTEPKTMIKLHGSHNTAFSDSLDIWKESLKKFIGRSL